MRLRVKLTTTAAIVDAILSKHIYCCAKLLVEALILLLLFDKGLHWARIRVVASLSAFKTRHIGMSHHNLWVIFENLFIRLLLLLTVSRLVTFRTAPMANNELLVIVHGHLLVAIQAELGSTLHL